MIERPPINKLPIGLLGFLAIKNGGRYPQHLSEEMAPVLDLWRNYTDVAALTYESIGTVFNANSSAGVSQFGSTIPVNIADGGGVVQVPVGEAWFICEAAVTWTFTANAGISADFGLNYVEPQVSRELPMTAINGWTTSDAVIARTGSRQLINPFFAQPQSSFEIRRYGALVPAGSVTAYAKLRFVRMPQ